MLDLKVVGAQELHSLARRLREQGDEGLMKEMRRALDKADKPLEVAVKTHVGEYFPRRYARILAKALKLSTRTKTVGRNASVRLLVTAKGSTRARRINPYDNPGILRHPVFGRYRYNVHGSRRQNPWVAQRIRPGFVSDHVDQLRQQVRRDLIQALHNIAEKVTKE